ncbi:MAG: hypothetical protein ACI4B3_02230 [Prevotella sp.]
MRYYIFIFFALLLVACDNRTEVATGKDAPIYPDYANVTIPVNIAPLNFLVRDSLAEGVKVYANGELLAKSDNDGITIDEDDWHKLLQTNVGKKISVTIHIAHKDKWLVCNSFTWNVVADKLDPYLTYRLIEPDYEVFSRLQLQERCVENFSTRNFCDHERVGNRCMNCHTYSQQNPELSMMYVRGDGGGAVLNRNGELSLLDIKADGMVGGSVYFGFHPGGKYIVFSANKIIPAFHSAGSKRLEVFDSASDVYVADLTDGHIVTCPQLEDSTWLETFPTFTPDGREIYFCTSKKPPFSGDVEENINSLQYHLCRISFDADNESFGTKVDTLTVAGTSICHPRVSPDGRYLLYTVQDYGTFPIWHRETDLHMLDLKTMTVDSLSIVNSNRSDTYHSWSSNSRWFVFASKRDDGLYGKPYFCYVDSKGKAHKPFVLPQRYPHFYDNFLKSFNAPELGRGSLPFTANDVRKLMKSTKPRKFTRK